MTHGYLARVHDWLRADFDRACAAVVCSSLGAVALAGSATHVLHVGAYPEVNVTGWMVWTVAGSLEVLAAYAAWEMRRRRGWDRLLPALVFVLSVGFIVLANLAAADHRSWAAGLPWAEAFAVAPPVSFVSVAAIAETRGWTRPLRRSKGAGTMRTAKGASGTRRKGAAEEPHSNTTGNESSAETRSPGARYRMLVQPLVEPGEERQATLDRWLAEGHSWKSMVEAGMALMNLSSSTIKREIRDARQRNGDGSTSVPDEDQGVETG